MRAILFFAILVSIFVPICQGSDNSNPEREKEPFYKLTYVDHRWPDRPFIVTVDPANKIGIKSLERYLNAELKVEGQSNNTAMTIGLPIGEVIKVVKSIDHAWNFAIDPMTVRFADYAMEICDASFMYIENDVDKWIEEVGSYCPWNASRMLVSVERIEAH